MSCQTFSFLMIKNRRTLFILRSPFIKLDSLISFSKNRLQKRKRFRFQNRFRFCKFLETKFSFCFCLQLRRFRFRMEMKRKQNGFSYTRLNSVYFGEGEI